MATSPNLSLFYPTAAGDLLPYNDYAALISRVDEHTFDNDKVRSGIVTTTDATVTSVLEYTPTDAYVTQIKARVIGRKSDGTAGAAYEVTACVRRAGGTVTLIGAVAATSTMEDNASWAATIDVSGTLVRVRVTGVAATTINWKAKAEILEIT